MLIADNEFGAPWNDQFYRIRMISIEESVPDIIEEILTLSGPKKYDEDELYEKAKNMFPHYLILNITCDS